MRALIVLAVIGPALIAGCTRSTSSGDHGPLEVEWLYGASREQDGLHHALLDYAGAWAHGFIIPGRTDSAPGLLTRFHFRHAGADTARYRYKIYYQNTSYKFPESNAEGEQHPLAPENFYGSWEDASITTRSLGTLLPGEERTVLDTLRIQGDPREEDRFLIDGVRHREGRNPRTGRYRFLLVLIDETIAGSGTIAKEALDIRASVDGRFVEPFWYFLQGPGAHIPGVTVSVSEDVLHVEARPDPLRGIHAMAEEGRTREAFVPSCGDAPGLMEEAAWQQYFHHIGGGSRFNNIPVVTDVSTFRYADLASCRAFMPRDQMVVTVPSVTRAPCTTVSVDTSERSIVLRNPATKPGEWRKESVGVRTRHALTYGRYRVQCVLPRLLNDDDVWNGLTNAIWLAAGSGPWSLRRPCAGGYMANYEGGADDARTARSGYAEIDFEILKTAPYCPQTSFPPNYRQPVADRTDSAAWLTPLPPVMEALRHQVMVSCTNWDMACPDPPDYGVGCQPIMFGGHTFEAFRWDHWYRALTQKEPAFDAEIFGRPYWFEIDWRPQDITWRIGPDLENMRVVGHMDASITSVPDIPMELIVTQEYHDTDWWPGSPYEQGFIPFSSKDHVGRILRVIID